MGERTNRLTRNRGSEPCDSEGVTARASAYASRQYFISSIIGARGPFSRLKTNVIPARPTDIACRLPPHGPPTDGVGRVPTCPKFVEAVTTIMTISSIYCGVWGMFHFSGIRSYDIIRTHMVGFNGD